MKKIVLLISSGLGCGFFPIFPGTVGSVLGVGVFLLFRMMSNSPYLYILNVLTITLLGVWVSYLTEIYLGKEDPSQIVIDEVAGQIVALSWLPINLYIIIAGFILFRIFDIFKPYPIRKIEKIPNGWGTMLDDVFAGFYTNIILICALWVYRLYL